MNRFWVMIAFVGIVAVLFAMPVSAKEYPFVLDRGFLYTDAFDIGGMDNEAGFVFQNPARVLPELPRFQGTVEVSSEPDFFGYDQLSLASQLSWDNFGMGFGIVSFSTDGIPNAELNSDLRPSATGGTFSDQLTRWSGVAAFRYNPRLRIGSQFTYFQRDLEDNSVRYFGLDLGFYYAILYGFGVGAYTRGALHGVYQWDNSTSSEALRRCVVVETDYRFNGFAARLSTDFNNARLLLQYRFVPQLGVHADAVVDDDFSLKRYGAGTSIGIGKLQLVYWYHLISAGQLDQIQHQLGFRFGI